MFRKPVLARNLETAVRGEECELGWTGFIFWKSVEGLILIILCDN
jgi:hypothetical protein